jgi:formiminoglutamase
MILTFTDPKLFFSKNDPEDLRLGDFIFKSDQKSDWSILGYADDEGISLNGGRPGAALAPSKIREYFYKMTPALHSTYRPTIADLGDLKASAFASLQERHDFAHKATSQIFTENKLITLGGGHDYGFPDAAAFLDSVKDTSEKPLILNFDAHLDVRPTNNGLHSGTPFRSLLNDYAGKFDFVEIGIQPQCNSRVHYDWALQNGATIFDLDVIQTRNLTEILTENFEKNLKRPLWISFDMDCLTSSEAPGCSASYSTGLCLSQVFPALKYLSQNFDVRGMGIYEVSPPLDQDNRTSKAAALLIHHLFFGAI